MDNLHPLEQAVGQHYDQNILEFETERLRKHNLVEYAITVRYLERYIEPGATVAEVGVGGGHYSEFLAKRGCWLYLIDVSQRLLEVTEERLRTAGLGERILDRRPASATGLHHLATGSCQAVAEAARVLKPGGLVYGAGINRLAFFRDAFRARPEYTVDRMAFHLEFLQDGNLDPEHCPPLGYAHLGTSTEFRSLFAGPFAEIALVGVESFTDVWQDLLSTITLESAAAWLDLVEQTGQTADGLGMSGHFLYIGQRQN
jgi:ubiquinone/menaquinone biosynthesis C-methylase UbiE